MKKLKNIQQDSFLSAIKNFGIEGKLVGNEFRCCCLFHDDKNPSMQINIHSGKFHCFSCGEGGGFSRIAELYNSNVKVIQENREIVKAPKRSHVMEKVKEAYKKTRTVVTDEALKRLVSSSRKLTYSYLESRGINNKSVEKFDIWDGAGKFKDRVCIPIRDVDGTVLSIAARHTVINDQAFKVRKVVDSKAKDTLFGLYELLQSGYEGDTLIILEGELDSISGQQCGYPTVGMMSLSLTDKQLKLLSSYNKIILCVDKGVDPKVVNKLMRQISEVSDVRQLRMKKYKDINDSLKLGGREAVHGELKRYKKIFEK